MVAETKKILDPKIKVTATCVRVPVFVGHSEAVNIEFAEPDLARRGARCAARRAGDFGDRQARGRRLRHADRGGRANTTPMSPASARTSTVENGLSVDLGGVSDNLAQGARRAQHGADLLETLIERSANKADSPRSRERLEAMRRIAHAQPPTAR